MAWHGMAYYIFLKSLRSLEEFRKNLHVKIPPKSPSTIFQSLAIIKNQILFRKEFFLHFQPNWPSGQPAHPAFRPSHGPFSFLSNRPFFSSSPLGLDLSAGPAHLTAQRSSSSSSSPRRPSTAFSLAPPPHPRSQDPPPSVQAPPSFHH
jgi:hypothetical protein